MANNKKIKILYTDETNHLIDIPDDYELNYVEESISEKISIFRDYYDLSNGIDKFLRETYLLFQEKNVKSVELYVGEILLGEIVANTTTQYSYKVSTLDKYNFGIREVLMVINE